MQGGNPAMSRRNLGLALRALREAAQITGEFAGAAVERSSSWISRVESGRVGLRRRELLTLLDLYGLRDPARITELGELADSGRQRAWWSPYTDALPVTFVRYLGVEAEARSIKIFQDKVMPGLLQTERYMRAVFERLTPTLSPAALEQNVRVRLQRQRMVANEVARLETIIDESVLRRVIGDPELMREQLGSILEKMAAGRADIRILPLSGQEHAIPNGTFTILDFADSPSIVYIDTAGGGVFEEGHSVTSIYRTIFSDLQQSALSVEKSTLYLRNLIGDFR
jgi:transcriptional regulator with XRE-family HTH domain